MLRSRRIAAMVLALLHVATLTALPLLHARHHARFGADHVHAEAGTFALPESDASSDDIERHLAFDESLVSLGLGDVFVAGTITVDCTYAAYTLVDVCSRPKPAHHTLGFGDALPHHHDQKPDPEHGLHSLAHGGVPLLATAPVLVVPAPSARLFTPPPPPASSLVARMPVRPASRGPPLV